MDLVLTVGVANAEELQAVAEALAVVQSTAEHYTDDAPKQVTSADVIPMPTAEVKKGRGRPKKDKPAEVPVKEALAASVAETPAEAAADASVLPDAAPTPVGVIATGQQLQEYILSLVHQKRLNPVAVKAKVYPKYGVVRSLDLTAGQVPLAKADVDAMLEGGEPTKPNDLDL